MKFIIEKSSKEALYCFGDFATVLIASNLVVNDDVIALDINSDNCEVMQIESNPPDVFVGRAYTYDNGWTVIDQERIDAYKKSLLPTVPQMLTPRQARLALLGVGLLDEVEVLLANDRAMQIWWEYSLDIQRNHEYTVAMAGALGLTEVQLDDLFIEASKL